MLTRGSHHAERENVRDGARNGVADVRAARTAFVNPARGYADVGAKIPPGRFSPRRYDVHPQTRFRRLWEPSRKRRGRRFWILRGRSVPVHAAASALRPSKILQLGPRPLFWGKSVRRNSGLDGAQGAPMPLAPVVMVGFGESGFVTVGSSALRGDAPLRTAATANADPGTSQIIAVWAMTWPRS